MKTQTSVNFHRAPKLLVEILHGRLIHRAEVTLIAHRLGIRPEFTEREAEYVRNFFAGPHIADVVKVARELLAIEYPLSQTDLKKVLEVVVVDVPAFCRSCFPYLSKMRSAIMQRGRSVNLKKWALSIENSEIRQLFIVLINQGSIFARGGEVHLEDFHLSQPNAVVMKIMQRWAVHKEWLEYHRDQVDMGQSRAVRTSIGQTSVLLRDKDPRIRMAETVFCLTPEEAMALIGAFVTGREASLKNAELLLGTSLTRDLLIHGYLTASAEQESYDVCHDRFATTIWEVSESYVNGTERVSQPIAQRIGKKPIVNEDWLSQLMRRMRRAMHECDRTGVAQSTRRTAVVLSPPNVPEPPTPIEPEQKPEWPLQVVPGSKKVYKLVFSYAEAMVFREVVRAPSFSRESLCEAIGEELCQTLTSAGYILPVDGTTEVSVNEALAGCTTFHVLETVGEIQRVSTLRVSDQQKLVKSWRQRFAKSLQERRHAMRDHGLEPVVFHHPNPVNGDITRLFRVTFPEAHDMLGALGAKDHCKIGRLRQVLNPDLHAFLEAHGYIVADAMNKPLWKTTKFEIVMQGLEIGREARMQELPIESQFHVEQARVWWILDLQSQYSEIQKRRAEAPYHRLLNPYDVVDDAELASFDVERPKT